MQHGCVETDSVLQKRKKATGAGNLVFNCRNGSTYRNLLFVIIDVYIIG